MQARKVTVDTKTKEEKSEMFDFTPQDAPPAPENKKLALIQSLEASNTIDDIKAALLVYLKNE